MASGSDLTPEQRGEIPRVELQQLGPRQLQAMKSILNLQDEELQRLRCENEQLKARVAQLEQREDQDDTAHEPTTTKRPKCKDAIIRLILAGGDVDYCSRELLDLSSVKIKMTQLASLRPRRDPRARMLSFR